MPEPVELDQSSVKHIVLSALPNSRPCRVQFIGEGGEHLSWFVDDDLAARFARDQFTSQAQRREIAVRNLVRSHVSAAIPVSIARGEWAPRLAATRHLRYRS